MRYSFILKLMLLPFLGMIFFSSAHAQSTSEEKGNGMFELHYSAVHFNSIYDNDGQKKPVPSASSTVLQCNFVYGIATKWNLLLNAPVLVQNHSSADSNFIYSSSRSHSSIGDIEVGIRFVIPEKNHFKSAINFYEGLGTGETQVGYGLNTGYGDFNQRLTFESAYKNSENWFLLGMVGINNHNKGFGDEGLAEVKLGGRFFKKVWLIARCGGVQPFENGDKSKLKYQQGNYIKDGLYYGLYSHDGGQWHYAFDLSCQVYKPIGVSLGYTGFIKGQYYPHAPIWSFSVFYKLTRSSEK